jgi:hypothetical protein
VTCHITTLILPSSKQEARSPKRNWIQQRANHLEHAKVTIYRPNIFARPSSKNICIGIKIIL